MIADYKGPANSRDVFQFMQGETIVGTLRTEDTVVLVFKSGYGFEFTSQGAFWVVPLIEMRHRYKSEVARLIEMRHRYKSEVARLRELVCGLGEVTFPEEPK